MNTVTLHDLDTSSGPAQELLSKVNAAFGIVPNLAKALANSPASLNSWLQFSGALAKGTLGAKLREKIALTVAQANGCEYCLAAHSYIGEHVAHLSREEIVAARRAESDLPKHDAALKFAKLVVEKRGQVTRQSIEEVRAAGFSEGEVIEIVATVVENILTNYINIAFEVPVDFPKPEAL